LSLLRYTPSIFLLALCFLLHKNTGAQSPSFFHLTTSNGLSDNNVKSLALDKNGFLWIAADEGLNVYDGYSITSYSKEILPQIIANRTSSLHCDKNNSIWMGTTEGVGWIDSKRKVHTVSLQDSISHFGCKGIVETKTYGIVLLTSRGQFYLNPVSNKWENLAAIPSELNYNKLRDAEAFGEDKILFATDSSALVWDYATMKMVARQNFPAIATLCRIEGNEIAVGIRPGKLVVADIMNGTIKQEYQLTSDINGRKVSVVINDIGRASNGTLVVASAYGGLITIDTTGAIQRHTHSPFDQRSIVSSNTYRILTGRNGEVVVATNTSGVSMFNIYNKQVGYTGFFVDPKGNYIDNFIINNIEEDKKGVLWMSTFDRLIRWDRKTNQSTFYYHYPAEQPAAGLRSADMRALCFDRNGKLWAGINGEGPAVFNEATGLFKVIAADTSLGPALRSKFIPDMMLASSGLLWACTNTGIYAIDPVNYSINTFSDHPVLKQFAGKRVNGLFEDSKKRIWITTNATGAYLFDPASNELKQYSTKEGLANNISYMVRETTTGHFIITTSGGFSVINAAGELKTYTKADGLKYERCESVVTDNEGAAWISNNKQMIRFDPITHHMDVYDDNAGFLNEGFRVGNCYKTTDGELIWSGYRGVTYFYPQQLRINLPSLPVSIYKASSTDTSFYFSGSDRMSLPFSKNNINFQFAAPQPGITRDIHYQYKLDGYDKEWQNGGEINQARYVSIPPGEYAFRVRASRDGAHWFNSQNTISIIIIPPIWRRTWFIVSVILLILGSIFVLFHSRNKKIRQQREQLETEQAINYFASSMAEHQAEESILWDVAKNCIGRLKFEDCVIYIMDEKKGVLVQTAAHGRKSPRQFVINKPLEIKKGMGIVGNVAKNARAEIIPDTTKDPRYIVDDEQRLSEISVPMIYNGKVLGVIDCEHSKKQFFTQKHLSILTTIASLCANKIVRARAEAEKQQAQRTLMDTQQKMTEVEMQALRAQMNPHFIFNCLNSINRYIVKSDQATASLYLTRFAKLIRLILDNSNSKNVILSNELEALKLYIEMEALRFDKKFTYRISVADNVSTDSLEVPPLIIQPYVENAIWHGLLHKEQEGRLHIQVSQPVEGMLQCEIEDNGIGREKAKEMKSKSAVSRKSLGMKLTEDRLSLLNKHATLNASIDIIDLTNGHGEATGTRVIIKIPV
jgi:ligand-binding sensor domain-containing protein/putative methionine-R-sulfoxide reductase with GAF domain